MSFRGLANRYLFGSLLAGVMLLVFTLSAAIATWLFLKSEVQGKVVMVPELFSKTEEEARRLCEINGLTLRIDPQDVHSAVVPAGHVLLQAPRAGRKIKSGRTVEITMCAGPEKELVPDMEGETLTFSNALLDEAGMEARVLSRVSSSLYDKGRVLAQAPEPGVEMALRQGVSLLVSDGPQPPWYVTPDLVDKDYLTVKAFLDKHEIRVITKYRVEDEDMGQVVLEQTPRAGYPINKMQTITLVVNKDF